MDYSKYQTSFKDHETKIVENLFDEEFYLKDIQNHKALVDTLFELTNKVKLYFQLEKKKMEVIDFNDMEHFAYQLLQDPMIKEEMYNKYQMILVDEFQDTNELQEKSLRLSAMKTTYLEWVTLNNPSMVLDKPIQKLCRTG